MCGKTYICLEKELATLGEELPPAELLPAKRKEQSPDPTKRDTGKQRVVRTQSASRRQHVGVVVMSVDTFGKF